MQWLVHFLSINKGYYMPHVIPTNRKVFSGRPSSFSIPVVISIIMTIPKTQKARNIMLSVARL